MFTGVERMDQMFILLGAVTVAAFLHCENEFLFFVGRADKIEYRLAT